MISPMPEQEQTIRVDIQPSPYDVSVGIDLIPSLGRRVRDQLGPRPGRTFLIWDDNLPKPTVEIAIASLESAGFTVGSTSITALESNKTLQTHESLCNEVLRFRLERNEPIVALGGGIVGDVAGYVASSYRRGVPIVQCPTTLLSMVDASVGGKTGVNLIVTEDGSSRLVKNMAGAFWQPSLVLADIATLRSLEDRQFRSGLFECVKHGLLSAGVGADETLFDWMRDALPGAKDRDESLLVDLVARNVAVKAHVVGRDERESFGGVRALLNLGHTFAHAIEPIQSLTPTGDPAHAPLLHGEAVGFGLLAAAATARSLRMIDESVEASIREIVLSSGLSHATLTGLPDDDALLGAMFDDKKVAGGRLRLILPESLGASRLVDDPPRESISEGWASIRA